MSTIYDSPPDVIGDWTLIVSAGVLSQCTSFFLITVVRIQSVILCMFFSV